jgi:hypothetical protein
VEPVLDDGTGPTFLTSDTTEVQATSAKKAQVLALRYWREKGARWLREVEGECPFKGMSAYRFEHAEEQAVRDGIMKPDGSPVEGKYAEFEEWCDNFFGMQEGEA